MDTPEVLSLSENEDGSQEEYDSHDPTPHDENEITKDDPQTTTTTRITQSPSSCETKLDRFFTKYYTFTNSSVFTERGIKLLQWMVWLLSKLTKDNQRFSKHLSPSLRKFYSELFMMRYVLRFYGMPAAIDGIRKYGSWAGSPPYNNDDHDHDHDDHTTWKDKRIIKLGNLMAWSMLLYHPCEHLAYGNWVMPKIIQVNGNKLSAWSCRFWLVYIVADWLSAFLKNRELHEKKKMLLQMTQSTSLSSLHDEQKEEQNDSATREIENCMQMNRLQMIRNFFFTPPCLTWALDKWDTDPLLSENVVNGMSLAEALICFYQTMKSM